MNTIVSLGAGMAIAFVPTFVFAKVFFKKTGAKAAKQIVWLFYLAEILKIILTAFLFFVVFYYGKPEVPWLFLGFMVSQVMCMSLAKVFSVKPNLAKPS